MKISSLPSASTAELNLARRGPDAGDDEAEEGALLGETTHDALLASVFASEGENFLRNSGASSRFAGAAAIPEQVEVINR